jgi:hypothetical protein
MRNFVPTENPFGLPDPPEWFLRGLWAENPALVIFPSRQEPVYRLVIRARRGPGARPRPRVRGLDWGQYLASRPDLQLIAQLRAYPVGTLLPPSLGMSWAEVLRRLPEHDLHRIARRPDDPTDDTAARHLEAQEAAREAKQRAAERDELDARAADAYRTLQLTTGARVGAGGRTGVPVPAPRGRARRPLGGAAMFIGEPPRRQEAAARA